MSPIPPPPKREFRTVAPLHLRCEDLSKPGSDLFFLNTTDPYSVLKRSVLTVLKSLYPSDLYDAELESTSGDLKGKAPGPKEVRSVTIYLREFDGVAYTTGSRLDDAHKEIHVSTSYLSKVDPSRLREEIEGVLVHELVHVYQHNANGTCNGGLIEGVADWVRLGAGLGPPHWRMGGNRWDEGYATTAFFLAFLAKYLHDELFVPKLNLALRETEWNDGDVLKKQLGGRDVEDLWKIYKKTVEDGEKAERNPPKPVPTHHA